LHNELTAWSKIHPVVFEWLANMPPKAVGGVDSGEKLPFSSWRERHDGTFKPLKSPAFRGGNARLDRLIVKPVAISPAAGLIFLRTVKNPDDCSGALRSLPCGSGEKIAAGAQV
jgi:hypothetical protein